MKRYWDHSEAERAKFTAERVEELLAYELMEKGVLAVEPLVLEEEAPVEMEKRRVYLLREGGDSYGTLLNVAFRTIEAAEACKAAIAFIRESPWNSPAHTRPVKALQVVAEDLAEETTVAAKRAALDEQKRRADKNAAARRAYEEAYKKVADATTSVWNDWRACRELAVGYEKIRKTFSEYQRMTDGNDVLAMAFLLKVFPADEVEAAGLPVVVPADPAEAVATLVPASSEVSGVF